MCSTRGLPADTWMVSASSTCSLLEGREGPDFSKPSVRLLDLAWAVTFTFTTYILEQASCSGGATVGDLLVLCWAALGSSGHKFHGCSFQASSPSDAAYYQSMWRMIYRTARPSAVTAE